MRRELIVWALVAMAAVHGGACRDAAETAEPAAEQPAASADADAAIGETPATSSESAAAAPPPGLPADAAQAGDAWFERVGDRPFRGHDGPAAQAAFDAISADMDLDGDADLVIGWHDLGPLELFENIGGTFERVAPGRAGLADNRGVVELYASFPDMLEKIRVAGRAGLYLWHDERRSGAWHFVWRDDPEQLGGLLADLETSIGFAEPRGLRTSELARPDTRHLTVGIEPGTAERQFHVRTQQIAVELAVKLAASRSGAVPPLFVGADMVRWPTSELRLWKSDPHGVAWVDVEDGERPELYVTRGALGGLLVPPLPPKVDHYFLARESGATLYEPATPGTLADDYGRGRRVEWVDVDNDGSLELSIGEKAGPDRLLVRDGTTGELRDAAARLGIAFDDSDVHAWADLDDDGYQDLFVVRDGAVDVALNLGGRGFEPIAGEDIGLALPHGGPAPARFDTASLRFADFDDDGDLDLWLLGYGPQRTSQLFRKDKSRFTDVSADVGLADKRGHGLVVLLDVDNDGFEDALSFGRTVLLWKNEGGERFAFHELDDDVVPETISATVALDADSDGHTDVVAVGRERHLLRNTSVAGSYVDVVLRDDGREPVGALVRAVYEDGRTLVRRYGSAHSTTFSQGVLPLRFGVAPGARIVSVAVRWPGERGEKFYEVGETGRVYALER